MDELDPVARARRPHVHVPRAHDGEVRGDRRQRRLVAAHDEEDLAGHRLGLRPEHRRVHVGDALPRQRPVEVDGDLGADGGAVAGDEATRAAGGHAVGAQIGGAHDLVVRQAGEQRFRAGGHVGCRARHRDAGPAREGLRGVRIGVVDHDADAGLDEVLRHGAAHGAESDESHAVAHGERCSTVDRRDQSSAGRGPTVPEDSSVTITSTRCSLDLLRSAWRRSNATDPRVVRRSP